MNARPIILAPSRVLFDVSLGVPGVTDTSTALRWAEAGSAAVEAALGWGQLVRQRYRETLEGTTDPLMPLSRCTLEATRMEVRATGSGVPQAVDTSIQVDDWAWGVLYRSTLWTSTTSVDYGLPSVGGVQYDPGYEATYTAGWIPDPEGLRDAAGSPVRVLEVVAPASSGDTSITLQAQGGGTLTGSIPGPVGLQIGQSRTVYSAEDGLSASSDQITADVSSAVAISGVATPGLCEDVAAGELVSPAAQYMPPDIAETARWAAQAMAAESARTPGLTWLAGEGYSMSIRPGVGEDIVRFSIRARLSSYRKVA